MFVWEFCIEKWQGFLVNLFFGGEQKRPGANRPTGFVPESPLQKGVFGSHVFSKEL